MTAEKDIFHGFQAEVIQAGHSANFPELGLTISPKDPDERRDHFKALVEQPGCPRKIQELMERFGYLAIQAVSPKYQYELGGSTTYSAKENSQRIFWHSDFPDTNGRLHNDRYNLLYNEDGLARTVTEIGFGDREVIIPELANLFETYPGLLEEYIKDLEAFRREIGKPPLKNLPEKTNFAAWAKIVFEYGGTSAKMEYLFAEFLGSKIARKKIRAKELLLFCNGMEPSTLQHSRIVQPGKVESVATHRNQFMDVKRFLRANLRGMNIAD